MLECIDIVHSFTQNYCFLLADHSFKKVKVYLSPEELQMCNGGLPLSGHCITNLVGAVFYFLLNRDFQYKSNITIVLACCCLTYFGCLRHRHFYKTFSCIKCTVTCIMQATFECSLVKVVQNVVEIGIKVLEAFHKSTF